VASLAKIKLLSRHSWHWLPVPSKHGENVLHPLQISLLDFQQKPSWTQWVLQWWLDEWMDGKMLDDPLWNNQY
jgi:hypothetical protein